MDDRIELETGARSVREAASLSDAVRASMAARLGVKGDFVKVPQLAKFLGISAVSIHSQMRRGIFPIAHRRVGNVIMVKFDDYAAWYLADDERSRRESNIEHPQSNEASAAVAEINATLGRESPSERKERFKHEVMAGMRRKGFKV